MSLTTPESHEHDRTAADDSGSQRRTTQCAAQRRRSAVLCAQRVALDCRCARADAPDRGFLMKGANDLRYYWADEKAGAWMGAGRRRKCDRVDERCGQCVTVAAAVECCGGHRSRVEPGHLYDGRP